MADFLGPRRVVLRRETISIPGLGPGLQGLRIAHLSDFHCGAYMTQAGLNRIFDRVWAEQPDLIVMTGDFIDYHPVAIFQLSGALGGRRAPPLGLFAVLGNHDYVGHGGATIAKALERCGVRCLRNASVRVERNGAGIWLSGVDDFSYGETDFAAALQSVDGAEPKILLCHSPDLAGHARDYGFDLMLSGHAHGGQIVLPIVGPSRVASTHGRRFIGGTVRVDSTVLHVSRGVGMAGLPIRIGCPAEFSLLTLTPAVHALRGRQSRQQPPG